MLCLHIELAVQVPTNASEYKLLRWEQIRHTSHVIKKLFESKERPTDTNFVVPNTQYNGRAERYIITTQIWKLILHILRISFHENLENLINFVIFPKSVRPNVIFPNEKCSRISIFPNEPIYRMSMNEYVQWAIGHVQFETRNDNRWSSYKVIEVTNWNNKYNILSNI